MTEEGGEGVCWLDRVCDTCGGIVDARTAHVCRPVAEPIDDGASYDRNDTHHATQEERP